MRKTTLLLAIGIASSALTMAAPAGEPSIIVSVADLAPVREQLTYQRLDDADALENLRRTNPRHYAIVRRILAAANEICDVSKGTPVPTRFDAKFISCAAGFWLTSLPPKHALEFRIDATVYSTLVTVTNTQPRLDPIH